MTLREQYIAQAIKDGATLTPVDANWWKLTFAWKGRSEKVMNSLVQRMVKNKTLILNKIPMTARQQEVFLALQNGAKLTPVESRARLSFTLPDGSPVRNSLVQRLRAKGLIQ